MQIKVFLIMLDCFIMIDVKCLIILRKRVFRWNLYNFPVTARDILYVNSLWYIHSEALDGRGKNLCIYAVNII